MIGLNMKTLPAMPAQNLKFAALQDQTARDAALGRSSVDGVGLSPTASNLLADSAFQGAMARTARTDSVLNLLAADPLQAAAGPRKEAYQAVRNDAWDRFNNAYQELPPAAQEAMQNNLTLIKSDFARSGENVAKFQQATAGEQAEMQYSWLARAAEMFAGKPGDSLKAMGSNPNMALNQATLLNLGDGARQYRQASEGYLANGGAPGQ